MRHAGQADIDGDVALRNTLATDGRGLAPEAVERGLREALDRHPHTAWLHARLINVLLSTGEVAEAEKAWVAAIEALAPHLFGGEVEDVVRELHLPVAALLLSFGQLDRAGQVLATVPSKFPANDPRLGELMAVLQGLHEVRAGRGLAPLRHLGRPEWWRRGPFLSPHRLPSTREAPPAPLVRWVAGRVVEGGDPLLVTAAELDLGQAEAPSAGLRQLSHERWVALCSDGGAADLRQGDFLEVGLYEHDPESRTEVGRVHPREASEAALPEVHPAPGRFASSAADPLTLVQVEGRSPRPEPLGDAARTYLRIRSNSIG